MNPSDRSEPQPVITPVSDGVESSSPSRASRYPSHALVELRRFRWLPFGIHSAVLLDMSHDGLKAEFTGESLCEVGKTYWVDIPLSPLGIAYPDKFSCSIECRWFDRERWRFGGLFVDLGASQKSIVGQIIEIVRAKARDFM